jgi:hypothetical protein
VKKVLVQIKQLKKIVETNLVVKRQGIGHSKVLLHLLEKYEDLNMRAYTDNNMQRLVFLKDASTDLKVQMDHMVENLKNPYDEMYHWCKGEIYDLQALADAVTARDNIEKN